MACTTNNVCLDVCLKIIITHGSGIDAVVDCGGACGTSPTIVISPSGSVLLLYH